MRGRPFDEKSLTAEDLAKKLEGRSGADIAALVNEAAMTAITRYVDRKRIHPEIEPKGWKIERGDIDFAMKKLETEISPRDRKYPERKIQTEYF